MDGPSPTEPPPAGDGNQLGVDPAGGDPEQARRAARVVVGAARDLEEARLFLEMLGLEPGLEPGLRSVRCWSRC